MQAAKTVSKYPQVDANNVIVINDKLSILKSKAIYGANASGKTNMLKAFVALHSILKNCLTDSTVLSKWIVPFLLDDTNINNSSFFQIIVLVDDIIYRYGFEATNQIITTEWLFGKSLQGKKSSKERYYFTREGMNVKCNEVLFKEGKKFASKNKNAPPLYRDNVSFMSVVAAFNGKVSSKVHLALVNSTIMTGLNDTIGQTYVLQALEIPEYKARITELLRAIDPTLKRIDSSGKNGLEGIHLYRKSNSSDKEIPFNLTNQVAEGTRKIFYMSPIIFSVLDLGTTLAIDEFDARMHPNLTRKIVELFHSSKTNPNNAQLIFATHDTNLLDAKLLRRDQISFAKKDKFGATEIYSLVEFKGIRNDASFEKDYLSGKYEAVPTNLNLVEEAVTLYHTTNAQKNKSN